MSTFNSTFNSTFAKHVFVLIRLCLCLIRLFSMHNRVREQIEQTRLCVRVSVKKGVVLLSSQHGQMLASASELSLFARVPFDSQVSPSALTLSLEQFSVWHAGKCG